MTRSFGYATEISLMPFTKTPLDSLACLTLYYAALDTFYPIAVNRRFDSLPGASKEFKAMKKVTEGNLFVVEIPQFDFENNKYLFNVVARRCGCTRVAIRKKPAKKGKKKFTLLLYNFIVPFFRFKQLSNFAQTSWFLFGCSKIPKHIGSRPANG